MVFHKTPYRVSTGPTVPKHQPERCLRAEHREGCFKCLEICLCPRLISSVARFVEIFGEHRDFFHGVFDHLAVFGIETRAYRGRKFLLEW